MSKWMYSAGKHAFLSGNIDWVNTPLSAFLIDLTLYAPDVEHASLADVPSASIISESLITGKAIVQDGTDHILFADDTVFESVPEQESDDSVTAYIIAKKTDTFSTSTLVFFCDESPEFPITPDGTDGTIAWDATDGIYRWP